MQVYFLRHAHAEPVRPGMGDADRRLDDEGHKQARRAAKWVKSRKLELDAIVSSPYPRARQTAEAVAEALGIELVTDERLAPGGLDAGVLPDIIAELGEPSRALLVGHEPDLSATISDLIGGGEIELKTGTLALVECVTPTTCRGRLRWLVPQSAM